MRAIDGDALRDKLRNLADDEWNQSTTTSWAEAFNECADMVDDAPTIESEQRWIPCSERLPEADVLCCDIRGEMIIGYPYQDDESNTGYSAVSDDVYMIDCIAWMEKPEPYKEGES